MLAAIGIDALGVRRGLKSEYFIFTDPLIILSGAILLDRLADLRFHLWAYPIAATLLGLHIAVSQAEPVKSAFMRRGTGIDLRMERPLHAADCRCLGAPADPLVAITYLRRQSSALEPAATSGEPRGHSCQTPEIGGYA